MTMTKAELNASISRNMIAVREALGIPPDEIAERLGISTRAYGAWERGERQRWTQMFHRLIYVAQLPVSTDFLLLGRGEPLVPPASASSYPLAAWGAPADALRVAV